MTTKKTPHTPVSKSKPGASTCRFWSDDKTLKDLRHVKNCTCASMVECCTALKPRKIYNKVSHFIPGCLINPMKAKPPTEPRTFLGRWDCGGVVTKHFFDFDTSWTRILEQELGTLALWLQAEAFLTCKQRNDQTCWLSNATWQGIQS